MLAFMRLCIFIHPLMPVTFVCKSLFEYLSCMSCVSGLFHLLYILFVFRTIHCSFEVLRHKNFLIFSLRVFLSRLLAFQLFLGQLCVSSSCLEKRRNCLLYSASRMLCQCSRATQKMNHPITEQPAGAATSWSGLLNRNKFTALKSISCVSVKLL